MPSFNEYKKNWAIIRDADQIDKNPLPLTMEIRFLKVKDGGRVLNIFKDVFGFRAY